MKHCRNVDYHVFKNRQRIIYNLMMLVYIMLES